MVAHANDLRYFYSAHLGRSEELSVTDGGVVEVAEALPPGRYLLHILDATGRIYVQQGVHGSNTPAATAPAFPMDNDGIKAIEIVVPQGASNNSIAARATAAQTATLVVTKISRDKN
jgi:hypothetical protein